MLQRHRRLGMMKKSQDDITRWHEKLSQAGVDETLIEQTRQTNLELQDKLNALRPFADVEAMQTLYQHYARQQSSPAAKKIS